MPILRLNATGSGGVVTERAVILMTSTETRMNKARHQELKRILEEHRLEIIEEVWHKIRDVRTGGGAAVPSQGVREEAEIQDDIEFALLQMKAETLKKIGSALSRLDEGPYGYCHGCGAEIAERRLRVLPFAVRCKGCEEAREVDAQRERVHGVGHGTVSLLADLAG